MKLKRIGHVALWVRSEERSKAFYRDVLGFTVSEQDPEHGGTFMTLGENFQTIDVFQLRWLECSVIARSPRCVTRAAYAGSRSS